MGTSKKLWLAVFLVCLFASGSSARAQDITLARNLAFGMSGSDVSALQKFLIDTNFLKILAPTGYFGPITRAALGEWQRVAGVNPPAGFFGSISRGRIDPGSADATTTVANIPDGSPLRLLVPTLGIVAAFQWNGTKADGAIEVPSNVVDAGWYTGSPHPGDKGNAIVTGHVAQIRRSVVTKQGIFYNLSNLRPGDDLYVQNDKGATIKFVVRASRLYDPTADATDVFTAKDNGAHLVLITCEGTWDQAQLEYTQRLVVFADAVQ